MKKQIIYTIVFSLVFFTVFTQSCKKDKNDFEYDILAVSTSYEDVQSAIDQSETGYIVKIPEQV